MKTYNELVAAFQPNMAQTENKIWADILVNILIDFEEENGKMMPAAKLDKKLSKRNVSYDDLILSIEKRIVKSERVLIIFKGDLHSVDSKQKEYDEYAVDHNIGKSWTEYDAASDDYLLYCFEYPEAKKGEQYV
ncbi:MAG: hypothetical protein GQ532_06320 [Methylomarinum sp.]|nr:hypothetical protein [Methylomarinum sp.]